MKLYNATGIVFRSIKYSESSLILDIYTPEKGLISCIVSGVRSSKNNSKANLYRPANILDIIAYHADQNRLSRIKEASFHFHFKHIHHDIVRSALLTFMTEVSRNSIIEREPNPELFHFLTDWYQYMDHVDVIHPALPLLFMKELSAGLGFEPMNDFDPNKTGYFDLQSGAFSATMIARTGLSAEESYFWNQILSANRASLHQLSIGSAIRKQMMEHWLEYYRCHLSYFKEVLSHKVLAQVFG
jgi:DNA repair protein RecO (recombination protein O)